MQKRSDSLQEDHLQELATFYSQHQKTTQEVELKKLQHIEQVTKMAEKHKWYLNPLPILRKKSCLIAKYA